MNIFVLDENPVTSAEYMCDKHVIKMTLESAQLLSNCHSYYNSNYNLYKPTHMNHPCSLWVRESKSNYKWLYQHFIALANEYNLRYHKIHKSYLLLYNKLIDIPNGMLDIGLTPFKQCMPDIYKHNNPVTAYRSYYVGDKIKFAEWSYPSQIPDWINIYGRCVYANIIKENWIEEYFQQGVVIV